jgi:hypothetical protein
MHVGYSSVARAAAAGHYHHTNGKCCAQQVPGTVHQHRMLRVGMESRSVL